MNDLGLLGEKLAVAFLKKNKYKILEQNYTNKLGEIDIIAKQKNTIIFIEVKARQTDMFGLPRESVTNYKQNKIRAVATAYLQKNGGIYQDVRFDVVEVLNKEITHIKNAF